MIPDIITKMIEIVELLKGSILDDIEDVRKANHEKLLDRNDIKLEYMEQIASLKEELNQNLIQEVQAGVNVDKYREDVDRLEVHLIQLSKLNTKLAAIVLPVKEMYREIIEDISKANGGSLFEVRA